MKKFLGPVGPVVIVLLVCFSACQSSEPAQSSEPVFSDYFQQEVENFKGTVAYLNELSEGMKAGTIDSTDTKVILAVHNNRVVMGYLQGRIGTRVREVILENNMDTLTTQFDINTMQLQELVPATPK